MRRWRKNGSDDLHFESKGFMDAVGVTDFPIRDHKVILALRRRRWIDTRTGKSFSLPLQIDITASGTRYSKEFGSFLKETYGEPPRCPAVRLRNSIMSMDVVRNNTRKP